MSKISGAIRKAISTIDSKDPLARNRVYAAVRRITENKIENQTDHDLEKLQQLLISLEDTIADIEGEFALQDAMRQLNTEPDAAIDASAIAKSHLHKLSPETGYKKRVLPLLAAAFILTAIGLAWVFNVEGPVPNSRNSENSGSNTTLVQSPSTADEQPLAIQEFILSDGSSTSPFIVKGRGSAVKNKGDENYISIRSIRQESRPEISAKPILLPLDNNAKKSVVDGIVRVTIKAKSGRNANTKLFVSCIFYALAKCKYEEFVLGRETKEISYFIFTRKKAIPDKRLFILLGTDPGKKNDANEEKIGIADIFSIKLQVLPI